MGKDNKSRRAAKAKVRARARARGAHGGAQRQAFEDTSAPLLTTEEIAGNLWVLAGQSLRRGDSFAVEALRRLDQMPRRLVLRAAEAPILEHVDLLWANGWQPVELLRQGRIGTPGAACARLLARAIANDQVGRRAATLGFAWIAQVEGLDLPLEDGSSGWVTRWADAERLDPTESTRAVLDTYACLLKLPPLEPLMPMPGPPGGRPRPVDNPLRVGTVADPMLERVRNLLAKAESTTFEAEATALTEKAQELITRHAIDAALLQADSPKRTRPSEIRIPIDSPYADAKSLLLQTVAETSRCRSVLQPSVQMSTVVGYADDVDATEVLFTSLLVQAQRAMNDAARSAAPGARTRRQSYRSAFLLAFTQRIGDRLREVNAEVVTAVEQEQGRSLLPVLTDRSSALDAYMSQRFGDLQESTVRSGFDGVGWAGGRIAADNAQLSFAEISNDPGPA